MTVFYIGLAVFMVLLLVGMWFFSYRSYKEEQELENRRKSTHQNQDESIS